MGEPGRNFRRLNAERATEMSYSHECIVERHEECTWPLCLCECHGPERKEQVEEEESNDADS